MEVIMTTKEKAEKQLQEELEKYRVSEAKRLIKKIKEIEKELENCKEDLNDVDNLELPKHDSEPYNTTPVIYSPTYQNLG